MKAYIYTKYGAPQVLSLEEVAKPKPKDNKVLVKVHALSINPAEWLKLTASFWMLRLATGFFKPKNPILGADIAGFVEDIGVNVKNFKVGDRIFGRCFNGGLAEYSCLEEDKSAIIPKGITYEDAASIPCASISALIALRDKGQIKAGQNVLINEASGGIGTYAIQLAKNIGTDITGVCSTENLNFVKSIGADEVIDYKKIDFTKTRKSYDLLLDLVGNRNVEDLIQVLKPNGICVLVGMKSPKMLFKNVLTGSLINTFSRKKVVTLDAQITNEDLNYLASLFIQKKIKACIEQIFPFESVKEAFEHIGRGRTKGKIVIKVAR